MLIVVAYHALGQEPGPITVTSSRLEWDLTTLARRGFSFVSLDDCAAWLEGSASLPARAACITFDDGYTSVVRDALPLLVRLGVPSTVFLVASRIGSDNRWPGQWAGVPPQALATEPQVREWLAAGMTIGAHSHSHPVLTDLSDGALPHEVIESGDVLAQRFSTPVNHFAYPYGRRGPREVALARQRYRTAVSAVPALVVPGAQPHDLPRLDAHDLYVALCLRLKDRRTLQAYLAARRLARGARRRLRPGGAA